jgi:bacillithiol biosynthesis cysteine-adding enzyme BshC
MLRPFHSSYLAGGMRSDAFLPRGFGDADHRRDAVARAAARRVAPELLAELHAQSALLPPSPAREAHLAQLAAGAAAVVTGQQVGLFLGPLYTLFKAASAVAVARQLAAETGAAVVPIFWLQTEDQDFAEVASCVVPRAGDRPLTLTLADDPAMDRRSLADRALGADVDALVAQLGDALAGAPHADEVVALLRAHYRPGVAPGRAFAGVLAALFAEEGLVVFDPRRAAVARLAAPVLRRSIVDAEPLAAALAARVEALHAAGIREQIPLRPLMTLSFFHVGGAQGPRYRLERKDGAFSLPDGTSVSAGALLALLERDPLRFSTSALLRPLVQDTLLPTAVYVGGPAEVDYFAQLPPLYAALGMEPPLMALRARFTAVTPRLRALLGQLSLTVADLSRPVDGLRAARRAALGPPDVAAPEPGAWLADLDRRIDAYEAAMPSDRALLRSIRRTRATVRRAVDRLAARHQHVTLDRDEVWQLRLQRATDWLRPEGQPQERVHAFPAFAAQVGLRPLVEAVLAAVSPLDPSVRELSL